MSAEAHYRAVAALVAPFAAREPFDEPQPWCRGKVTYLDRVEAVADYACQRWDGDILEIGAYGGAATTRFGRVARRHGRHVLTVDNWRPGTEYHLDDEVLPGFLRTIADWRDVVDVLKADCHLPETRDAILARGPFAFSFVDDGHEDAEQLFDCVTGLMATRGVCCVDDVGAPHVRIAINQALQLVPGWHEPLYIEKTSECFLVRLVQSLPA